MEFVNTITSIPKEIFFSDQEEIIKKQIKYEDINFVNIDIKFEGIIITATKKCRLFLKEQIKSTKHQEFDSFGTIRLQNKKNIKIISNKQRWFCPKDTFITNFSNNFRNSNELNKTYIDLVKGNEFVLENDQEIGLLFGNDVLYIKT